MSRQETTGYVPYEATATAIADESEALLAVLRIFPGASPGQVEQARQSLIGAIHDGIEIGLACSKEEPLGVLEAYKLGRDEGFEDGFAAGIYQAERDNRHNGESK